MAKKSFVERTAEQRERIQSVAPEYVRASREFLFPQIWERPGLSKRDRSMITLAVLQTLGAPPPMRGHIANALANGMTKDEVGELITHVAFYAGFPYAAGAAEAAYLAFQDIDEE